MTLNQPEDFDYEYDDSGDYDPADDGVEPDGVTEPYRDGQIHVMAEKCATCVFRPGNKMNLPPGRLKGMTDSVQETGIPFSCHQTLPYADTTYQEHYGGAALCHGAIENYGDQSPIFVLARTMDQVHKREGKPPLIVEHDPYPGKEEQ